MENKEKGVFKKAAGIINKSRIVFLNLLFLAFLTLLILSFWPVRFSSPEKGSVLYLNPTGKVVLRNESSPLRQSLNNLQNFPPEETLLMDLKNTIDAAALDNRIDSMVLDFSGLYKSGPVVFSTIEDSLRFFKEQGKPVFAYSYSMNQEWLPLYGLADFWAVDPFFFMDSLGYGSSRLFYGKGMNKWGISSIIYKAGDFKSYTDVYTNEQMTPEAKEESRRLLHDLWDHYTERTEQNLSMESGALDEWIAEIDKDLKQHRGDWAQLFIDKGWADQIMTYSQFTQKMEDRAPSIEYLQYNGYIKSTEKQSGRQVALLPLTGEIIYGEGNWGNIGSSSVIRTLEQIEQNPSISALVLWIDSPGGSAMASEEIRRKLIELKKKDFPLVVLMNNITASGGYWISTAADYIIADPSTITGSIGVFSYEINAESFLEEELGVVEDGYYTSDFARKGSFASFPSESVQRIYQSEVEFMYQNFLQLVSQSRGTSMDELNEIAEGRVWTGREALEIQLVDQLGTIDKAREWLAKHLALEPGSLQWIIFQENYGMVNSDVPRNLGKILLKSGYEDEFLRFIERNRDSGNSTFQDPRGIAAYAPVSLNFF